MFYYPASYNISYPYPQTYNLLASSWNYAQPINFNTLPSLLPPAQTPAYYANPPATTPTISASNAIQPYQSETYPTPNSTWKVLTLSLMGLASVVALGLILKRRWSSANPTVRKHPSDVLSQENEKNMGRLEQKQNPHLPTQKEAGTSPHKEEKTASPGKSQSKRQHTILLQNKLSSTEALKHSHSGGSGFSLQEIATTKSNKSYYWQTAGAILALSAIGFSIYRKGYLSAGYELLSPFGSKIFQYTSKLLKSRSVPERFKQGGFGNLNGLSNAKPVRSSFIDPCKGTMRYLIDYKFKKKLPGLSSCREMLGSLQAIGFTKPFQNIIPEQDFSVIKKLYRAWNLKNHPDKGGDQELVSNLNRHIQDFLTVINEFRTKSRAVN